MAAPYIRNPDENPCHACAPVMVYGADHERHSTGIFMGGDQSSGHRRCSPCAVRPSSLLTKSISSTAKFK